jgi:hypothetical protein
MGRTACTEPQCLYNVHLPYFIRHTYGELNKKNELWKVIRARGIGGGLGERHIDNLSRKIWKEPKETKNCFVCHHIKIDHGADSAYWPVLPSSPFQVSSPLMWPLIFAPASRHGIFWANGSFNGWIGGRFVGYLTIFYEPQLLLTV